MQNDFYGRLSPGDQLRLVAFELGLHGAPTRMIVAVLDAAQVTSSGQAPAPHESASSETGGSKSAIVRCSASGKNGGKTSS
jgi:hypothetical protein